MLSDTEVSISTYNTVKNPYTCPSDGYIRAISGILASSSDVTKVDVVQKMVVLKV